MKKLKRKCQCPEEGILDSTMRSWYDVKTELPFVNHKPNECKCNNELKRYKRRNKVLILCSCCYLFDDKEVLK